MKPMAITARAQGERSTVRLSTMNPRERVAVA